MTAAALESKPPSPADQGAHLRRALPRAAGAGPRAPSDSASTRASTWATEVARLPARTLYELPLPPTLALHVPGIEGVVRINIESERVLDGDVEFDPDEWRALVIATEADRLWPDGFVELCHRKQAEPSFRVGLVRALDGGQPDPSEQWNVSRVLTRWGVMRLLVDLVS